MPSKRSHPTLRRSQATVSSDRTAVLDQEARDHAAQALAAIASHEILCTERYKHVAESLEKLRDAVEGLYNRFWLGAISTISLLIAACGVLLRLLIAGH